MLTPEDAERILKGRLGAPINPVARGARAGLDNDKVLGFAAPNGRVLALNREISAATHIWFEPPAPPKIEGVSLRPNAPINANLSGSLAPLNKRAGLQVEIADEVSLTRFLDWYTGGAASTGNTSPRVDPGAVAAAFARFQHLMALEDEGRAFTNFQEGAAAAWEGYKPRLRDYALSRLSSEKWQEAQIGTGEILQQVIDAIEIQDSRVNLTNNLVFWQNRFGHANRDHRALLEAQADPGLRRDLEQLFFELYRGPATAEGDAFSRLSHLTGSKYPLMAYLFFLKDGDRFMPIQPTTFDRAFRDLGVDLVTLQNCSWENYQSFNSVLADIRSVLAGLPGLSKTRLVDAHSFLWLLMKLPETTDDGKTKRGSTAGRIVGGRERAVIAMRVSIENAVRNSNGQTVERVVKIKETDLSSQELDKLLAELLDLQGNRCALTGIALDYSTDGDKALYPSCDRIDSSGQYVRGNMQVVARFINFWKGASENEEFKRLLMLVREGNDDGRTEPVRH